jgi:hypothetical protein
LRALGGVVLVDGGITSMREGFATWAEARTALSPPHLAGTPVEEFRAMIPMFFGDAVDVTPKVEDIVLAVMRVGADGTIRPRLNRANPPPDPARHLGARSAAVTARLRTPALAILARGGDADRDVRRRGGRRRAAGVRLADAHRVDGRHPRSAAAASPRARPADPSLRPNRRTIEPCSCSY